MLETVLGTALTVVGLTQAALALLKRKENMAVQVLFGAILIAFSFVVKLYADIPESVVTVVFAIIGVKIWYTQDTKIHHTTKDEARTALLILTTTFVVLWLILRFTDDVFPAMDALTTGLGLAAGWLMAKKSLQAWSVWFVYDILTCVLYWNIEAIGPTILSFVWIFMAVGTYIVWFKEVKANA